MLSIISTSGKKLIVPAEWHNPFILIAAYKNCMSLYL